MLRLKVKDVRAVTPEVRQITLTSDKGDLPGFSAGAHIRVDVPGVGMREYSLMNLDACAATENGVSTYTLGVRLEKTGTGGSIFMHALTPGDYVSCAAPKNDFPLGAGENPLLIAGGIGITPIASMISRLAGTGADFALHYSGRSRGALAFVPEVQGIAGDRVHLHYDDTDTALDLKALIGATDTSRHVYVCGPKGMIKATQSAAQAAGFAPENIHFELFARAASQTGDRAFEVEIASSGDVHLIPADQTIIAALEAAGLDLMYDCQRGDCGICQTSVVSGTPDHRDVVLSDDEKAAGDVMQICVSRAKSNRLVLDI